MTQEEKELLLKDLCARAQYNVKILVSKGKRVKNNGKTKYYDLVDTVYGVIFYNDEPKIVTPQNFSFLDRNGIKNFGGWSAESVKPFLRPMSSMTKEEVQEINKHDWNLYRRRDEAWVVSEDKYNESDTGDKRVPLVGEAEATWLLDYFNSHHFDYRGLIEKGLAIEARENMY